MFLDADDADHHETPASTLGSKLEYLTVNYRDIEVCWLPDLDGGGRDLGQNFLPLVKHLFGRVERIFEMCAGPGYIGFSMLAEGLCDSLALSDVAPDAVAALRETVRRNGLANRVTVYHSDGLADVPDNEKCDLFVVNPPMCREPLGLPIPSLISDDPGWSLHRAFYGSVAKFLAPGGSVLVLENSTVSNPEDFVPMIKAGGLQHVRTLWYSVTGWPSIYFMWSKRTLRGLLAGGTEMTSVRLDLQNTTRAPVELSGQAVYALRLHNVTGQNQVPQIVDDNGKELLGISPPLAEIRPDGELEVPRLALLPGRYLIRSVNSGTPLANLKVLG